MLFLFILITDTKTQQCVLQWDVHFFAQSLFLQRSASLIRPYYFPSNTLLLLKSLSFHVMAIINCNHIMAITNKQDKKPLPGPSQQLTSTQPVWAAENQWQSPNASYPTHQALESLMDIREHWLHATALDKGPSLLHNARPARILSNMQHSLLLTVW